MRLSVVVVNWNSCADLMVCLEALDGQTHKDLEIIVIDNGSTDESVADARDRYPNIDVLEVGENLGFAEGCNRGIEASHGEWVAVLNNDTIADPRWAEHLVAAAEAAPPRLGMLQSVLLFMHRPNEINSTGIVLTALGSGNDRGKGENPDGLSSDEIFCPTAGACAYRRAMLEEIKLPGGYFDRGHFMYFEDLDLGWRARLAGWSAQLVPDSIVLHKYQGSAVRHGTRWLLVHSHRNRLRTLIKNASPRFLARTLPRTISDVVRLVRVDGVRTIPPLVRAVVDSSRQRRIVSALAREPREEVETYWVAREGNAAQTKRPQATPLVLIDATLLRSGSGNRGIGRFVYDLLHGLEATRDEWQRDMRIRVVSDIDWQQGLSLSDDLAEAAESLFSARGTERTSLRFRRRMFLDRSARDAGAGLLHLPEALGTPLTHEVRRVVTCHDLIPLRLPDEYLENPLARTTRRTIDERRYRAADRIVAISERTRTDLAELLGITGVDVVPNGIDLSQWSPKRLGTDGARLRTLGVGERPFAFYVGYWDARKDIPAMLRTVAAARAEVDLELVWAGHFTNDERRRLGLLAAAHGLEAELARVKFVGFVSADDLAVLYRHAVAHLFLSRLEGFGLSVVEAMASGCPVIVARGSGADEVGGDAVVTVAPGDVDAAARALVQCARGSRPASEAGVLRARQFDRRAMARGYVEVFRRTLGAVVDRAATGSSQNVGSFSAG